MDPQTALPKLLAIAWLLPLASFVLILLFGPRMGKAGKGGGYAMAYPTKGDTRLDDPDITHLSIGWAEPSGREVGREGRGFPEFLVVLNWYDLQP